MSKAKRDSSDDSWQPRKETLAERSERVIGKALIPDTAKATGDDSPGRKSSTGGTRRQQVLHAQRNHRLRTQQYIRELEKEVFRLRDIEKQLLGQVAELSAELQSYRVSKEQHFSPWDTSTAYIAANPTGSGQPHATRSSVGPQTITTTVHVDLTGLQNVIPVGSCTVHPATISPPEYVTPIIQQQDLGVKSEIILADMRTQTALDFVLNLEKPCLPHVKHAHIESAREPPRTDIEFNSGPSHLLTVTAGIIHERQFISPSDNIEQNAFSMSESSIENLFRLSLTLPLTGEVTPVQIWDTLKGLSTRFAVTAQRLRNIQEEFQKYIQCNSFGAVVPVETANKIFATEFSLSEAAMKCS